MKETAVDWLVHELDKQMIERDKFDAFDWIFEDLIKQAKAMEREQIVEAFGDGAMDTLKLGKEYYNYLYKNSEQ